MTQVIKNDINHFLLLLDRSSSMGKYKRDVVRVTDELVRNIAIKSTELEQETRITIASFADRGKYQMMVWDKDVLRMPSIDGLYEPYGWTAMIEGVCLSLDDLATVPTKYGNHAFVVWVITDGEENDSIDKFALKPRVARFGDNYTLAALVPDKQGKDNAVRYGFPTGNIEIWDATSALGVENVIKKVEASASAFMETRKKTGARSTKSLFTLNTVSVSDIQANLSQVYPGHYQLFDVPVDGRIDDFVVNTLKIPYKTGDSYYELTKRERIQSYKQVAILANNKIWAGDEARKMLGLPDDADVDVSPGNHPGYVIFVQSTALNRKLLAGTRMLYLPGLKLRNK